MTEYEQNTIKDVVTGFDPDAEIKLFGSHIDDAKKGGDIDLLIISESLALRDLRNAIVYEYIKDELMVIFIQILKSTPVYLKLSKI